MNHQKHKKHKKHQNDKIRVDELAKIAIGAAIEVHKELGPGLLESTYEACLAHELQARGLGFERQKDLPVWYKGMKVACGFRLDLLLEDLLILELKAVERLLPIHTAQLLTYLKLTDLPLGLLLKFNTYSLGRQGIKRVAYKMNK